MCCSQLMTYTGSTLIDYMSPILMVQEAEDGLKSSTICWFLIVGIGFVWPSTLPCTFLSMYIYNKYKMVLKVLGVG